MYNITIEKGSLKMFANFVCILCDVLYMIDVHNISQEKPIDRLCRPVQLILHPVREPFLTDYGCCLQLYVQIKPNFGSFWNVQLFASQFRQDFCRMFWNINDVCTACRRDGTSMNIPRWRSRSALTKRVAARPWTTQFFCSLHQCQRRW